MAKCLHRFSNADAFRKSYFENGDYEEPWIGAVNSGEIASYNRSEEVFEEQTQYLKGNELTFNIQSDGEVKWRVFGASGVTAGSAYSKTIEYSLNGGEWVTIDSYPTSVINVVKGDVVKFRGDNENYMGKSYYHDVTCSTFYTTCEFSICGNIMSLIDSQNFENLDVLPGSGNFIFFFRGCTGLTDSSALKLPTGNTTNSCYFGMFQGCVNMKGMPVMPKCTTAATSCYEKMFSGCAGLRYNIPKVLEHTYVDGAAYDNMFYGCESMVTAPEIAATELGWNKGSYSSPYNMSGMFQNCTSLVNPPSVLLPDVILDGAYCGMFRGCSSLTKLPVICGTTFGYAYTNQHMVSMFADCTSLVSAITFGVYATGGSHSYNAVLTMFSGCTKLTYIPPFPYSTIGDFQSVFKGCTSLVDASHFLDNVTTYKGSLKGLFENCTSLTEPPSLPTNMTLSSSMFESMFKGCTSLTVVPEGLDQPMTASSNTFKSMFEGCVGLTDVPTLNVSLTSSTATAAGIFSRMFYGCSGITASPFTYLKSNLGASAYSETFIGTRIPECPPVSGTSASNYVFYGLFSGSTSLTGATHPLVAETVGTASYGSMFRDCSNLVSGPTAICATTVGASACSYMFSSCKKLQQVPDTSSITNVGAAGFAFAFASCSTISSAAQLNAETIGASAYAGTFRYCSSMTTTQSVLPAYDVPSYAYDWMYLGCSKITDGPQIRATAVTGYNVMNCMFSGCTSLTAVTGSLDFSEFGSSCCSYMFSSCASLTYSPIITCTSATTNSFKGMFSGCTSLQYVTCLDDAPTTSQFTSWMTGAKANGTFYASATAIANNAWDRSASGVPSTWTIQQYNPPV